MKTIEERIMEVGAKVLDEMLLHNTHVLVTIEKDSYINGNDFFVYVDVHPVTVFRDDEMEELKYRIRRVGLSEEGKKQLDRMWHLKKEMKEDEEEVSRSKN